MAYYGGGQVPIATTIAASAAAGASGNMAKNQLQEMFQRSGALVLPTYETVMDPSSQPHLPRFTAKVTHPDWNGNIFTGTGASKKDAEKAAAIAALTFLSERSFRGAAAARQAPIAAPMGMAYPLKGDGIYQAEMPPPPPPQNLLQEYCQSRGEPLPTYETNQIGGTPNLPLFQSSVILPGEAYADYVFIGEGGTKKDAERAAASAAYDFLIRRRTAGGGGVGGGSSPLQAPAAPKSFVPSPSAGAPPPPGHVAPGGGAAALAAAPVAAGNGGGAAAGADPDSSSAAGRERAAALAAATLSPQTRLQEQVQRRGTPAPLYNTMAIGGLQHAPLFQCVLTVPDVRVFLGEGGSKKEAERDAAAKALVFIEQLEKQEAVAAMHRNPSLDRAERVILIDLENSHAALAFRPKPTDFVLGFVSVGGQHAVLTEKAKYEVRRVPSARGDAVDVAIILFVAKLIYGAEAVTPGVDIFVISNDHFKDALPELVAEEGTWQGTIHALNWDEFIASTMMTFA